MDNSSIIDHDYIKSNTSSVMKKKPSLGTQCSAMECFTYTYKMVNGVRVNTNIPMYRFATNPQMKREWCKLIRREDGRDGFCAANARVCKKHFRPCDFKKSGKRLDRKVAKPLLHPWNNFTVKEPRRLLVRDVPEEVVEDVSLQQESESESDDDDLDDVVDSSIDISFNVEINSTINPSESVEEVAPEMTLEEYRMEVLRLRSKVAELELEVDRLKTEKSMNNENVRSKFVHHILSDDDSCSHETGFHSVARMKP